MRKVLILLAALAVLGIGVLLLQGPAGDRRSETYEIERTEYKAPERKDEDVLADDRIEDKKPLFDAALVDSRPLGEGGAWLLNASAAVLRLDVPIVRPDVEPDLLTLHPSYTAAIGTRKSGVLPSVNLLDGKAKQFDDGLYAALDLAYYRGLKDKLRSHVELIRRMAEKSGKGNPAAPYLAAGLELAGVKLEVADAAAKEKWLGEFRANEAWSKPIGFYTWSEELATLFRFVRFFQREFDASDAEELKIARALATLLAADRMLLADYRKALDFYARLSNPNNCLSLTDILKVATLDGAALKRLAKEGNVAHAAVAVFPPSTSKEAVLFAKLFPQGVPPEVDLMKELVRRIRSGEVDLKPTAASGWYEYQVYALETLLLPEKGQEKDKLLLTEEYKKRMLEAFKALVTKRRETHARQMMAEAAKAEAPKMEPPPEPEVAPRLRVEPAPTYYLRTARAYAFLANFLESAIGKEGLQSLRGLKQGGERSPDLRTELLSMRDLFYGLYLVSAEDIGMKADFAPDETIDRERCYKLATEWLAKAMEDADLAADTRVAVPIYFDIVRNATRLWITLGVRLTKLDVEYARPPSIKPAKGEGDWKVVAPHRLLGENYLIPVDEFAEVEMKGIRVLSREELRAICDREKTKEAILEALRK